MKYFLDNHVSPRIGCVLGCLGVDVVHLRDLFPPATPDTEWLPEIALQGRVVITVDAHIRTRPPEAFALRQARTSAVFLFGGFGRMDVWDQTRWLLGRWREIEGLLRDAPGGLCLTVPHRGHIRET